MRCCVRLLQTSASDRLLRLLPRHLPSGITRLPASVLGATVITEFGKLEKEAGGVVSCIDPENGWYEVNTPHGGSCRHADNEVAVVLLSGPLERWLKDPSELVTALRAQLRQGIRGSLLNAPLTRSPTSDKVLHIVRGQGSSLSSYLRAATRAAASGHTLVVLTCRSNKLDAFGLDSPSLEVQHPHAFRSFYCELDRIRDVKEHRNHEPNVCTVVVPLPSAPPLPKPSPRVLVEGLSAFYARQDLLAALYCEEREGILPPGKDRDLESSHAAYLRLQSVVAEYMSTQRGIHAPYPLPAALLHHELQWGSVECHLGSILQAIPEPQLLRFGDNLLLPISSSFLQSTMMPLLQLYASEHASYVDRPHRDKKTQTTVSRRAAEVPIVRFFTWTWERLMKPPNPAMLSNTQDTPSSETRLLWTLHFKGIGPLAAYEGYLARWFAYFPHAVQLRNINGEMHACYWTDSQHTVCHSSQ
jgi:hypothetical protein